MRFNLQGADKVSIIIPNLGRPEALRTCVNSIDEKTSYRNYEVIIIGDPHLDSETRNYLASRSCQIIAVDESSNLSHRINLSAAHAQGAYLLFLHGDTEVISADWITGMLGFCRQQEIGAVGAKLLSSHGPHSTYRCRSWLKRGGRLST